MQLKKFKKSKGFTLVELLVVIAILAVLATVSIVGYTSFTKKAKVSNDVSLTTQMNTILQANEVVDGKNATPHEAVNELIDGGLDVTKLTPTANGYNYVWDSTQNRMILLDEDGKVVSPSDATISSKTDAFIFVDKKDDLSNEYSNYLKNDFAETEVEVSTGIDVGENENVTKVTYTNALAGKNVIIRTNGGSLIISDTNDDSHQIHYGYSDSVTVATGSSCYEGHALVSKMIITEGKVIAGEGSFICLAKVSSGVVLEEKNEGLFIIPTDASASDIDKTVAESIGYTQETSDDIVSYKASAEKEDVSYYKISTEDELNAYRDASGNGARMNAKLMNDIVLTKEWVPFASGSYSRYKDTFDGNNKTIYNITINSSKNYQGFFAQARGAIIKNLKLVGLKINAESSWFVGGLVGYVDYGITIENCSIDSTSEINGNHRVGGFVGSLVGLDEKEFLFKNLTNYAKITAKNNEAQIGGIVGQLNTYQSKSATVNVSLDNCQNYGELIGNSYQGFTGGIVGAVMTNSFDDTLKLTINNCSNNISLDDCAGYYKGHLIAYFATTVAESVSINNCIITGDSIGMLNKNRTYKITVDGVEKTIVVPNEYTDKSDNNKYTGVKFADFWWGKEEA